MEPCLRTGFRAAAAAAVSLLVLSDTLPGQQGDIAQPDRIGISYGEPKNPEHQRLRGQLEARRALETLREYLSPIRLPDTLTLKVDECGISNAWYEPSDRTVTICYEYIADVLRNAPKDPAPLGANREDAIVGPITEVFLHEVSHALFDLLKVPILGREEDAADQVAAFLLLQLNKDEARRTVVGTAYMYLTEAQSFSPEQHHFADVHGLPHQRYYNLLCIAYGADPVLFADAVERGHLPRRRAESCKDEYDQVAYAFRVLIAPHLDPEQTARLQGRRWLEFESPPGDPARAAEQPQAPVSGDQPPVRSASDPSAPTDASAATKR